MLALPAATNAPAAESLHMQSSVQPLGSTVISLSDSSPRNEEHRLEDARLLVMLGACA